MKAILADLSLLQHAQIPVMYKDIEVGVGYAIVNAEAENRLSALAHTQGRCGNYEALEEIPHDISIIRNKIQSLASHNKRNINLSVVNPITLVENEQITNALSDLQAENIKSTVEFLTSFKSRYNKLPDPNLHIQPFMDILTEISKQANYPITLETINHKSTKQKSIKLTITGSERPDEIIVLGGHLDSIVGGGGSGAAPGADDNASGSASLVEALRVITTQPQPQRTIEFYWYAGEESGLLGSSEIAETSKRENKNIIAVLQLDMTMFPGDGPMKIASMTDFTSAWLRDYLKAMNTTYLNITIEEDRCGYGCSDHASWYRRGYSTLFPTESKFNSSFRYIHTPKDVISPALSFEHALIFSKIALTMAMDLGNSELQQPIL
ncbi:MAG: M20/M25/M40 family metallo-hydrolase [Pseudobdellovibrio sp.]